MRAVPAILVVLTAVPAAAETEQALSIGVGYATYSAPGPVTDHAMAPPAVSPTLGGALVLGYERAFGTDLALRAELGGGVFYGDEVSYAALADLGATLRFDVLEWVPYGFAGVGGLVAGGGPLDGGLEPVLVVGGGVDRLLGRTRAIGGEVRVASFGGDVTVVTVNVRGSLRWGFF